MNPTVTTGSLFALLALFVLVVAAAPMSDEDVVRLYVSGTAVDEIIEKINSSEVAFDLSEDMLDELRLAGLPSELIEAMIARQEEIDGGQAPPIEEQAPAGALLRININPDGGAGKGKPLRVLDLIEDQTHEQLKLRTDSPTFTDMAIFLACRTQDHVPDQWRGKSPLGRDFIGVQRHRMLHFHSGAALADLSRWKKLLMLHQRPGEPDPRLLELELPTEIAVELEPGVAHDLTLGIAMRTEERFYLIAFDELDGLVLEEERSVNAEIRGGRDFMRSSLKVRFRD